MKWAVSLSTDVSAEAGGDLPDWAVGQAMGQLVDGDGPDIEERARQLSMTSTTNGTTRMTMPTKAAKASRER